VEVLPDEHSKNIANENNNNDDANDEDNAKGAQD
jgi:hypothetical protein